MWPEPDKIASQTPSTEKFIYGFYLGITIILYFKPKPALLRVMFQKEVSKDGEQ
jgi:hypothetical protein